MRFFFDTEFIEDGKTIDLISIGIVGEDGRTFYAENSECDLSRASPWVQANVLPHLLGEATHVNRKALAEIIRLFVGNEPEFWGYFADYDWVVLCQLYGRMVDLPKGWPMFCLDVRQTMYQLRAAREDLPKHAGNAHNALDDAKWTRDAWRHLQTWKG